jgi:hypothetical protein
MSDTGNFGDSVYEGGDAVDDTDDLDPIANLTGDDPDEEMQTGYNPPDREPYNLRHIPTPAEEREGESLDQRLSEEVPDVSPDDVFGDEERAPAAWWPRTRARTPTRRRTRSPPTSVRRATRAVPRKRRCTSSRTARRADHGKLGGWSSPSTGTRAYGSMTASGRSS